MTHRHKHKHTALPSFFNCCSFFGSANNIENKGGKAFGEALTMNATLKDLVLGVKEGPFTSYLVLYSFQHSISLFISANKIGVEGFMEIFEGLKTNTTITDLNLYITNSNSNNNAASVSHFRSSFFQAVNLETTFSTRLMMPCP